MLPVNNAAITENYSNRYMCVGLSQMLCGVFYQNGHRFECCALYAWPDKDDNLTALGASKGAVNILRKNLPSH